MPFFNSIPLGLVIVQLVQLGLAEGEAEAETESIREREEGERGKKNEKEENSRTLYPLPTSKGSNECPVKSGHQMKLVAGRARR